MIDTDQKELLEKWVKLTAEQKKAFLELMK